MKIEKYQHTYIRIDPAPRRSTLLNDNELRELVAYIKKEKPEILRDIMCEDCPEVC